MVINDQSTDRLRSRHFD